MIRCGLIGYGAWGEHHARVIAASPDAALVAVAARSEPTRQKVRQAHPGAETYGEYRDLLARDDLDAAVVVLPSHLHHEVGSAVLRSGRHLLLEKPMCLTAGDCDRLNELARERGLALAVGHEMRLSSLWGRVKELLDAGALGRPLYALVELWRRPYRLGADGWRYDADRVGSWVLEEPIHFFDLARWYFAALGEPVSVYARANGKRADHPELHDHFSATLAFPGGAFAVIAQCLGGWEHHQVVKLSGTEGALWASWSGAMDRTFEPNFSLKLLRVAAVEDVPIPRAAGEVFELADQFARFTQAVQAGARPAATGEDGRWSVLLCEKAQESIASGRPAAL
jgi:myo-inositol 2-dehydrogenase/D-chiro-inositol 1-dehydrogenase